MRPTLFTAFFFLRSVTGLNSLDWHDVGLLFFIAFVTDFVGEGVAANDRSMVCAPLCKCSISIRTKLARPMRARKLGLNRAHILRAPPAEFALIWFLSLVAHFQVFYNVCYYKL